MSDFRKGQHHDEVERFIAPYLSEIERLKPAFSALPGRHSIGTSARPLAWSNRANIGMNGGSRE